MKKLAIITTHPIQYNAPIFRLLNKRHRIQIKVFYTWENSKDGFYDKKFKQQIKWDIPLLEGYEYEFVKNTSSKQGTHHRMGIVNPTLIEDIESWEADAVLIYGWNFHSHFKAMRHFKGKIPVLFRGDSTLLDETPGLKTTLRRFILKFVYRYIDFALYVGTNNKNYFLKHGLKEKQLVSAPHSVENERFFDTNDDFSKKALAWKEELKIQPDELVFLFAGKFENKKDPLILMKVAELLKDKKLKFIFAGDGILKEKMTSLTNERQNVLFLPFQNQQQMPVLYRLADVFVLPSKGPNETWGLAVNEAMACEKAVLVSDKVGGAIDLVENGKNGYVFEAGNLEELVKKLSKFNKHNSELFGKESKKMISNFNFLNICQVVEDLLDNLNG
jgi:glycosyltransferase involved in cell wall biosynthesis